MGRARRVARGRAGREEAGEAFWGDWRWSFGAALGSRGWRTPRDGGIVLVDREAILLVVHGWNLSRSAEEAGRRHWASAERIRRCGDQQAGITFSGRGGASGTRESLMRERSNEQEWKKNDARGGGCWLDGQVLASIKARRRATDAATTRARPTDNHNHNQPHLSKEE